MKNNILTIIKKEFSRFFGDPRIAITTILLPGLLIYVLYSFMGSGMKMCIRDRSAGICRDKIGQLS